MSSHDPHATLRFAQMSVRHRRSAMVGGELIRVGSSRWGRMEAATDPWTTSPAIPSSTVVGSAISRAAASYCLPPVLTSSPTSEPRSK